MTRDEREYIEKLEKSLQELRPIIDNYYKSKGLEPPKPVEQKQQRHDSKYTIGQILNVPIAVIVALVSMVLLFIIGGLIFKWILGFAILFLLYTFFIKPIIFP